MSEFKFYSGEELFALNLPPRPWLVEEIIHQKDTVLLVGNEKAGKSLLAFQLVCSMTSGHPFLDTYEVTRPCKVSYLQLEGELEDSLDRFKKMSHAVDLDLKNLQFAFLPPINLEDQAVADEIIDEVKDFGPDLLILDPVYFALEGDLSDNTAVRRFIGNIRRMKNKLNCAIMMVHHTHKDKQNARGKKIQEGDEAVFGSKFFKAYPDHTLLFLHDQRTETRHLTCSTQRSGKIVKEQVLTLEAPDPLYYKLTEQIPTKQAVLLRAFPEDGTSCNYQQLADLTQFSRQTIYATIRELLAAELITRNNTVRPVLYNRISV